MKRIIFGSQKNINNIIENILKNNELEEDLRDYSDKIDQGIKPYFDALYELIYNFASEETDEMLFLSNIRKELNITGQTADNILKEIKKKVLPLVIILSEDEIEKETNVEIPLKPIGQPIGVSDVLLQVSDEKEVPTTNAASKNAAVKTSQGVKKESQKTTEKKEIKQNSSKHQKKRNDVYREPIG